MATSCSVPEVSIETGGGVPGVVKRGTIEKGSSADVSDYTLVDDESQIEPALSILREAGDHPSPIAVDCEGDKLSRDGKLSIVSVSTEDRTFLFDIKKLGAKVFNEGLKEILEDPDKEKLMYDCRSDSDCFWHQYQVKLANVIDLQLMQVIYRETNPEPTSRLSYRKDEGRVRGILICLEHYVKDYQLIGIKKNGVTLMDRWMERPLSETQLEYAVADNIALFKLYDKLKTCMERSSTKGRLRLASQRFLAFHRDRPQRSYNKYERNAFVPWRIVPDNEESSYAEQTECVGCKRRFPRSDFSNGIQKCPVCKRV